MKLVTFRDASGERVGMLDGNTVLDLASTPGMPNGMLAIIARAAQEGLGFIAKAGHTAPRLRRDNVVLLAPIPRPAKNIFCVGKNYHEHAMEFHASGFDATASGAIPDAPIIFSKPPTTVIGPDAIIPAHLDPTASVDYENELAVVIGRGGRGIQRDDAMAHVFGYTIVNDVTSRTLQHQHKQWFLGKGIDGFCPMGPSILTSDEVPDVAALRLTTRVNGEIRQQALVRDLIFDIPFLIETISRSITLEPGDIIATGTPAGVGIGFSPPRFLAAGDVVSAAIEPIGELVNRVG